jgi:hypothetical protein
MCLSVNWPKELPPIKRLWVRLGNGLAILSFRRVPLKILVFSNCENRDVDLADFTSFAVSLSCKFVSLHSIGFRSSGNSLVRSIVVLILILSPRMTWVDSWRVVLHSSPLRRVA